MTVVVKVLGIVVAALGLLVQAIGFAQTWREHADATETFLPWFWRKVTRRVTTTIPPTSVTAGLLSGSSLTAGVRAVLPNLADHPGQFVKVLEDTLTTMSAELRETKRLLDQEIVQRSAADTGQTDRIVRGDKAVEGVLHQSAVDGLHLQVIGAFLTAMGVVTQAFS